MPTTTEVVYTTLVPGSQPGQPDNHAAGIMKSTVDTLHQQDGCQRTYFGPWVEKPDNFQLIVDWDSKGHHDKFTQSEAYGPFTKNFATMIAGDTHMCHVDFQPPGQLHKTFSAPVTEVATFYFEGAPPSDYQEKAEEFLRLVERESVPGVKAWALGTTHEEIEREGVKGKGAVLFVGWESVDAHMKFRETQLFKDEIHRLRSTAKTIEMHHVAFMQAQ